MGHAFRVNYGVITAGSINFCMQDPCYFLHLKKAETVIFAPVAATQGR